MSAADKASSGTRPEGRTVRCRSGTDIRPAVVAPCLKPQLQIQFAPHSTHTAQQTISPDNINQDGGAEA